MTDGIITYPARGYLGSHIWVAQDTTGAQWFGADAAEATANVGDTAASEEAYRAACQRRMSAVRASIEAKGA